MIFKELKENVMTMIYKKEYNKEKFYKKELKKFLELKL